jgi:hypothetical protein
LRLFERIHGSRRTGFLLVPPLLYIALTGIMLRHQLGLLPQRISASVRAPVMLACQAAKPHARLTLQPNVVRFMATGAPAGPTPPRTSVFRRAMTVAKWCGFIAVSSVVGLGVVTGAIFVHDAMTYNTRRVPSFHTYSPLLTSSYVGIWTVCLSRLLHSNMR